MLGAGVGLVCAILRVAVLLVSILPPVPVRPPGLAVMIACPVGWRRFSPRFLLGLPASVSMPPSRSINRPACDTAIAVILRPPWRRRRRCRRMLGIDDSIIWRRSNSGLDDRLHSTVGRALDNPSHSDVIVTSETRSGEESEKDRRENGCRTHIQNKKNIIKESLSCRFCRLLYRFHSQKPVYTIPFAEKKVKGGGGVKTTSTDSLQTERLDADENPPRRYKRVKVFACEQ